VAFSLAQFLGAFEIRNNSVNPYVIIGGQAVNFWAETYLHAEPELAAFLPFVSKDIDFLGGRNDVEQVARQLRLEVKFPDKRLRTAFAGAAMFRIGEKQANIEFVRRTPAVSATNVEKWAVSAERDGQSIRVIDPVSLLASKLELALTVDQRKRRDADHFKILLLCVRAFLREILARVDATSLPARSWLAATERHMKLAESRLGKRAMVEFAIHWADFLPRKQIEASNNQLIVQFRRKRLVHWTEKLGDQRRPGRA
jgi:hypothetical protein